MTRRDIMCLWNTKMFHQEPTVETISVITMRPHLLSPFVKCDQCKRHGTMLQASIV